MKILVTGGAGFIGSHIVDALSERGYVPIVVDNLATGNRENVPSHVAFYELDILSDELEQVFKHEVPDAIIHAAAQVIVSNSIQNPKNDALINILGTIRVMELSVQYKVKKFIYSSSCAVYGDTDEPFISEKTKIKPLSFYGLSKATAEYYILQFCQLYDLPYSILRYANVYGPRQRIDGEGGVISILINHFINNKAPIIFGDGTQTRDFVYVKDVAEANILAISKGDNQIINIGSGCRTSINEVVKKMQKIGSFKENSIYASPRIGDIKHSALDIAFSFEQLGWKPLYNLENGLKETIEYYKQKRLR
jgi:UDP-glucose 4-epimerase